MGLGPCLQTDSEKPGTAAPWAHQTSLTGQREDTGLTDTGETDPQQGAEEARDTPLHSWEGGQLVGPPHMLLYRWEN